MDHQQEGDGEAQAQAQAQSQAQAQARQQPQKCPRCDSVNTKFCYYNNYSLSQPRYFCKTCRRYWTQGGTLRKVPVGGGSRKGKRAAKNSSTAGSSSSRLRSLPQQDQVVVQTQQTVAEDLPSSSLAPVYQGVGGGGGYLASLAAMNSSTLLSDQYLNVGGDGVAVHSSYMGLLSGFDLAAASLGLQSQLHQPLFYQPCTGGSDVASSLFSSQQQGLVPSTMTVSSQHGWSQQPQSLSFINNAGSSSNIASIGGGGVSGGGDGGSVVPDQWRDVTGYDAPPPV